MAEVGIGLGSNLGDRCGNLVGAIKSLAATEGVEVAQVSSAYVTPPWGLADQPEFLNACALLRTSISPEALLASCKAIEQLLGRTPTARWGPRVIDIDLLFYDDLAISSPDLILPHAHMFERLFVLIPLAEIVGSRNLAGRDLGVAIKRLQSEQPASGIYIEPAATDRLGAALPPTGDRQRIVHANRNEVLL